MPPHQILFYDADQGKAVYGTWIDDNKHDFVLDQDELDLIRWGCESPNVEPNPYENLRVLKEEKIYLRSGKVITRKYHDDLELVYDDGFRHIYRTDKWKNT